MPEVWLMASVDFKGAGASSGIEAWRIEKLSPVKLPGAAIGNFYEGEGYRVQKAVAAESF